MDTSRRSPCPVSCTLDLLGDRWTLLVVRDLLAGKQRFEEFLASPEGISTNILTERLRRLEKAGLVTKQQYGSHSRRMAYQLTPAGQGLREVLLAVARWGQQHLDDTLQVIDATGRVQLPPDFRGT